MQNHLPTDLTDILPVVSYFRVQQIRHVTRSEPSQQMWHLFTEYRIIKILLCHAYNRQLWRKPDQILGTFNRPTMKNQYLFSGRIYPSDETKHCDSPVRGGGGGWSLRQQIRRWSNAPNVSAKWFALTLHFGEVPGSKTRTQSGCSA
jgi:hypothetical protein